MGALAAAVIGGALWALIAVLTNYEIGLVAWAIGNVQPRYAWQLPNRLAQNNDDSNTNAEANNHTAE